MNRPAALARLAELQSLVLDRQLAALREAEARRARSLMQLAALDTAQAPENLQGVAADLVALRYQRWADARRSTLNLQLSQQTADWLEAQAAARLSFGKQVILRALAADKERR
jgi:hypothetical protein